MYKQLTDKFSQKVAKELARSGLLGFVGHTLSKGFKRWNPDHVALPTNTICRGVTREELDSLLKEEQIPTYSRPHHQELGSWSYSEQAHFGNPALLSFANRLRTSNMYGANRKSIPRDGGILIVNKPAFYVPLSFHARLCPELCHAYQEIFEENYYQLPHDERGVMRDWVKMTIECDEVSALVGRHNGADFSGLLSLNNVHTIFHVFGSGRGRLVDCQSCLMEKFINPEYRPRAVCYEVALNVGEKLLSTLALSLNDVGALESGHRVLTADDAAFIVRDPELRELVTRSADSSTGTITVFSVPEPIRGSEVVPYIKSQLQTQLDALRAEQEQPQRPGIK